MMKEQCISLSDEDRAKQLVESVEFSELENSGVFVKPAWFNACMKGNSLWPYTNVGVYVLSFSAILGDQPTNGSDFIRSTFSPEQLSNAGRRMSDAHHAHNINLATTEHLQPGDRKINPNMFQGLWRTIKSNICTDILKYMAVPGYEKVIISPSKPVSRDLIGFLNDFFVSENYESDRQQMNEELAYARDIMLSPQGLALARLHIFQLDRNKSKNAVALHVQDQANKIRMQYEADCRYGSSNNEIMENAIKNILFQLYPNRKLDWLGL